MHKFHVRQTRQIGPKVSPMAIASLVTNHKLDGREIMTRVPTTSGDLLLPHCFHVDSGTHLYNCSTDTGGCFVGVKAVGT